MSSFSDIMNVNSGLPRHTVKRIRFTFADKENSGTTFRAVVPKLKKNQNGPLEFF